MNIVPKKVIVVGTGRLARSCLELCLPYKLDLECIEPEDASFSILSTFCKREGVKYLRTKQKEKLGAVLLDVQTPTLIVSAYNGYIFPKSALGNPHLNIVNFHNSLLPRHRGRNAPTWTLYEMDSVTGITWHQVGNQIDKGQVICQKELAVAPDITALELTLQTLELGAKGFDELLPALLRGNYSTTASKNHEGETFHLSHELPNGGIADCSWPLHKLYAFLRSMDYGRLKVLPPARVSVLGHHFEVVSYRLTSRTDTTLSSVSIDVRGDQVIFRDDSQHLEVRGNPRT